MPLLSCLFESTFSLCSFLTADINRKLTLSCSSKWSSYAIFGSGNGTCSFAIGVDSLLKWMLSNFCLSLHLSIKPINLSTFCSLALALQLAHHLTRRAHGVHHRWPVLVFTLTVSFISHGRKTYFRSVTRKHRTFCYSNSKWGDLRSRQFSKKIVHSRGVELSLRIF